MGGWPEDIKIQRLATRNAKKEALEVKRNTSQKQKTEDEDEVMEEFSIIQPTEVDNSNDSKSFDSDDDDQVLQAVKQNQSKQNNTTFIVPDDMAPLALFSKQKLVSIFLQ